MMSHGAMSVLTGWCFTLRYDTFNVFNLGTRPSQQEIGVLTSPAFYFYLKARFNEAKRQKFMSCKYVQK